jgi:hypothetical protein
MMVLVLPILLSYIMSSQLLKLKIAISLFGWNGLYTIAREQVGLRLLGHKLTQSRFHYHLLMESLRDVELQYCIPTRRIVTEKDLVECHRLLTSLISTGIRIFYEVDLLHPHFEEIVNPHVKLLGDNPDALYFSTIFDPKEDFIVKGTMNPQECYLSLTVYDSPCIGCFSQKVIADLNHFHFLNDKTTTREFEIIVSKKPKPLNEKRHWLSLEKLTGYPQLITRHYYENELSAQLDANIPRQNLTIQPLNPKLLHSRDGGIANDVDSAERFDRIIAFVKSHTIDMIQDPSKAPTWFSFIPNTFGPAKLFRDEVHGLGAVDIVYSAGPFKFENPDEDGLIITAVMPKAVFVNIVLWNQLLQTLSYEYGRPISLNRKQMKRNKLTEELTGPVKILLSKRLPKRGLPSDMDWLDSEGRHEGSMFWRFLLPENNEVQTPEARLVKIDSL